MKMRLTGDVVDNDTAFFYDFFGMNCISPNAINEQLDKANGEDIDVSINSNGGDVFAASEIYTELKQYTGNVTISVTGIAASAASVISMAADTLKMSPTAQIMIHNASSSVQGDTRDMAHESQVLNNVNESMLTPTLTRLVWLNKIC
ncbi:Clp protease ClpP [Lentilactobacillus kosonis]|uniref:Prophage Clp protease-like protein n=1 Tax=Lentilactobacillus kosonis TaxID=2810561 RepID=A0A401FPR1_9LACO|nr:Clp protease ClpP [Lentilactobacillus kosonis]GAY74344.1 prophage Clp protease-like protein [Lentilactobacillus kosonis]